MKPGSPDGALCVQGVCTGKSGGMENLKLVMDLPTSWNVRLIAESG